MKKLLSYIVTLLLLAAVIGPFLYVNWILFWHAGETVFTAICSLVAGCVDLVVAGSLFIAFIETNFFCTAYSFIKESPGEVQSDIGFKYESYIKWRGEKKEAKMQPKEPKTF